MGESKKGTERIVGDKIATVFGLWSLIKNPHELLEKIGLSSSRVYHQVPSKCYVCEHDEFSNLSLIGVYRKPVFYECDKCGALHLRYKQDWLEAKFNNLQDAYINPQDWENEPPPEEYN